MKIDFIIISLILVLLVFLPFFLLPLIKNSDRKRLEKKSKEESSRYGLNLDLVETWSMNFIAIDSVQKKMLWIQKLENEYITECIDLSTVKATKLVISETDKKISGKTEKVLQRIDLEFRFFNEEVKNINFFDYDLFVNQDLEVLHAEKWNGLIQKQLSPQKYFKRSA